VASDRPSEAALIAEAREGSAAAVSALYERHNAAALRAARAYLRDQHTAEDVAADSFVDTMAAVRSGRGPREALRPYLLVAVRNKAADSARLHSLVSPVADDSVLDGPDPQTPAALAAAAEEQALARQAFEALPERWQLALWHREIEGESLDLVAERLGMSTAAAAALVARAREGLRERYVAAHLGGAATSEHPGQRELARHVRGRLTPSKRERVEDHLGTCARCRVLLLEARAVASSMRLVVAPAMLGVGVAAYRAGGRGAGASTLAAGRTNGAGSSASGDAATSPAKSSTGPALPVAIAVACVTAVAFVVVLALAGGDGDSPPAASSTARSGAAPPVPVATTPAVTPPTTTQPAMTPPAAESGSPPASQAQAASPNATSTPPPGTVAIDVSMQLRPALRPGRTALARVRVRNTSGFPVTDAVVSVTLPPGVSAVRVTSGWTVTPQGVSASLGSLGAGGDDVLTLRLRVSSDAPAPVPSPAVSAAAQPSG